MTSHSPKYRRDADDDVAIVGLGCMFPGAPDIETYWQNILSGVDSITDPPGEAWNPGPYLAPELDGDETIYCTRGGYLGKLASFNPLNFGIMPRAVESGEPDQWLALEVAHQALVDAGYAAGVPNRERTAVILGKGTYLSRGNCTMIQHSLVIDQTLQLLKTVHPELTQADLRLVREDLKSRLPRSDAETVGGMIPNVVAGRIANRFDLMGPTYTVDAACASSLVAADIAIRGLRQHEYDLALIGGVQMGTAYPVLMLFCQVNALSRRQQIRPFDKDADGTLLSEGLGMAVIKRRVDAERDGDRIYAVIKGVGVASDGRALGVLAPRLEGEELAIRRAYESAAVEPSSIGLIEAHGTATLVGDVVEFDALSRVFGERVSNLPGCGVGSVKSMIGHTMPASGMAGLIKLALSLYHKVLPPTINVDDPNPKLGLDRTPFYINTRTRPWIHSADTPRRAGLNAFGFGGINAHLILEDAASETTAPCHMTRWESELCILQEDSRDELIAAVDRVRQYLDANDAVTLKDVAYTVNTERPREPGVRSTLAIVATSVADLRDKLGRAQQKLADPQCRRIKDPSGVYFFAEPLAQGGKLAFLFPGEGAQYPNMLADLCQHFPEVRACFDLVDRVFAGSDRGFLPSDCIFPRPRFASSAGVNIEDHLWQMDVAIEAVGTANQALNALVRQLEIRPDAIVGHSTGEYSALEASGIVDQTVAAVNQRAMNKLYREAVALGEGPPKATLLAVGARREQVGPIVEAVGRGVCIAMDNCPHQVVLVVADDALTLTVDLIRQAGWVYEVLRFDRPYHTEQFRPHAKGLSDTLNQWIVSARETPVLYSCTTVGPFPTDVNEIRRIAFEHWMRPVEFRRTVERMHDDGVRIFLEVGPRGNLTAFVDDILKDRPFIAVPLNVTRRTGISQLNHALGLLSAHGVSMNLEYLYSRRSPTRLDIGTEAAAAPTKRRPEARVTLVTVFPMATIGEDAAAHIRARVGSVAEPPPTAEMTVIEDAGLPTGDEPEIPATIPPQTITTPVTAVSAVDGYFRTMSEFLALEQQVMSAQMASDRMQTDTNDTAGLPFIETVVSHVPGERLVAQCDISIDRFDFLRSHTLGREISIDDPNLAGLPVMPLTGSMEILAQGATVLAPDLTLVGMRNVRAHRWLAIDGRSRRCQITATRQPGALDVQVELREAPGGDERHPASPIVEATVVFSDDYPEPPVAEPLELDAAVESSWAPERLYLEAMFHGPAFQGVRSMDRVATDGAEATIEVLEPPPCDGYVNASGWVTDFVLLDQPGQVVGFWAAQLLEHSFLVFPYRLDELQLYGPRLTPGERLTCQARIQLMGEQQVRSTLDLVRADGSVWARLVGWEDRRFDFPPHVYDLLLRPSEATVSSPWFTPIGASRDLATFEAFRLGVDDFPDGWFSAHGGIWRRVLASLVLSDRERALFEQLTTRESRRVEWLLGRIAAKDAVRHYVAKRYGLVLCPADVEILPDPHGQPVVQGAWTGSVSAVPAVSLSHVTGLAVAVAGASTAGTRVGVDLERVGRWAPGTERVAFTGDEQHLISTLHADEWPLRCWCAKEATAKVTGKGFAPGIQHFRITEVNPRNGEMRVAVGPRNGTADDLVLTAFTAREGDLIVATSLMRLEEGPG